jgi:hypothetical protein
MIVIVFDEHFRRVGKNGYRIVPNDADLCHIKKSFVIILWWSNERVI